MRESVGQILICHNGADSTDFSGIAPGVLLRVNSSTVCLAMELASLTMLIKAVHPGWSPEKPE